VNRAIILVMDSFGLGGAPDAARFGDEGANTFAHIAAACDSGICDKAALREGPLSIPNLNRLGLAEAAAISVGNNPSSDFVAQSAYGAASEKSRGKDTPSGHWEMAGLPVSFDWGYFPNESPCFPVALTDALISRANLSGLLGNRHASGTIILEELGDDHVTSGKPIVYTSADSVFQIAAHETSFGLERLYEVCEIARGLVDEYEIGRVIARPFVGSDGNYERTGNRHDYATPPFDDTLLDFLREAGGEVISIGKVADIFSNRGISRTVKANGNDALWDATLEAINVAGDQSIIFVNFVDFDTLFGHRRNVIGYAAALEAFDQRLPEIEAALQPNDIAIITADHGCDPTWPGTDHTRENVPVIAFGAPVNSGPIGLRDTFADIGQTIAAHLGLDPLGHGKSFLGGNK
jgi:phosphopentomutase